MNDSTPPITIVSGLPRSGTSMMMQMLEAGGIPILTDHERAADDDNPRGYYEFEPVKKTAADPSWLREAPGKAVKIIYALLRDLPADTVYHVIFMRRPIEESVRSQEVMLERLKREGSTLSRDRMRDVFERELTAIGEWLQGQENFRILDVDYRSVVSDPAAEARRIGEFLGLDLDTGAMATAVDPKLHRQKSG